MTFCPAAAPWRKRMWRKKYSLLNWPWQLCFLKGKKKHSLDETPHGGWRTEYAVLSYIRVLVFSKIDNSGEKKKHRQESARFIFKNMTSAVGCSPFTVPSFSSSPKSAIWNTVPFWSIIEPRMALMVWNVPKRSYTAGDIGTRQENHPNQVTFFALEANGQLWPRQI